MKKRKLDITKLANPSDEIEIRMVETPPCTVTYNEAKNMLDGSAFTFLRVGINKVIVWM